MTDSKRPSFFEQVSIKDILLPLDRKGKKFPKFELVCNLGSDGLSMSTSLKMPAIATLMTSFLMADGGFGAGYTQVGVALGLASVPFIQKIVHLSTAGINPKNIGKIKRLAEQDDDREAQMSLGCCFYLGDKGVPLDKVKAAYWFRDAAEQDLAEAKCPPFEVHVTCDGKRISRFSRRL